MWPPRESQRARERAEAEVRVRTTMKRAILRQATCVFRTGSWGTQAPFRLIPRTRHSPPTSSNASRISVRGSTHSRTRTRARARTRTHDLAPTRTANCLRNCLRPCPLHRRRLHLASRCARRQARAPCTSIPTSTATVLLLAPTRARAVRAPPSHMELSASRTARVGRVQAPQSLRRRPCVRLLVVQG